MESSSSRTDRTLLVILGIIVALVVVAVVVVFTRGTPGPLDPKTPEGVVQRYAVAVINGDEKAATELLAPEWIKDCEQMGFGSARSDVRITLIGTKVHGDTATVRVTVATSTGSGPFGGSEYQYDDAFQLDQAGQSWLIRSAPWELSICPGGKVNS